MSRLQPHARPVAPATTPSDPSGASSATASSGAASAVQSVRELGPRGLVAAADEETAALLDFSRFDRALVNSSSNAGELLRELPPMGRERFCNLGETSFVVQV